MSICPWSQVWVTLRRLGFIFSTSSTFSYLFFLFPKVIVPFPSILADTLSPNVTLPFYFFIILRNFLLSPIICLENPLLIYHWHFFFLTYKDTLHYVTFSSTFVSFHIFLSLLLGILIFKDCVGNLHSLALWP